MIDCSNIEKITDVTNQIEYQNTHSGVRDDSKWVSCGQDGNYSELQNKFTKYFKGITKESWMAKSMCECCKNLKPRGEENISWLKFYRCFLSQAPEKTETFEKISKLINWHKENISKI